MGILVLRILEMGNYVKKQSKTMEWIKGFEKWFLNVLLCPYHLTAYGRPSMRSFAAVLLVRLQLSPNNSGWQPASS